MNPGNISNTPLGMSVGLATEVVLLDIIFVIHVLEPVVWEGDHTR
jgi:hypothetical protein